mgnify:CR=1 FL=1
MKKITIFILLFSLMFSSAGCSTLNNKGIFNKNSLAKFSVEQLNEKLIGIPRDEIIDILGEPDGMCFGMYCDFYNLSIEDESIGIYYGEGDKVYEVIKIDYK